MTRHCEALRSQSYERSAATYIFTIINSASATNEGIVKMQKRLVIVTIRLAKDLSWSKTTARPGMVVATGHMEQM